MLVFEQSAVEPMLDLRLLVELMLDLQLEKGLPTKSHFVESDLPTEVADSTKHSLPG